MTARPVRDAYVGLGANLGDAAAALATALRELSRLGPLRASGLYRSEPLGDPDQPWYLNAVAELRTSLSAEALLVQLQALERAAGRPQARARWAPRVLDLDLLVLGDLVVERPQLRVPHPEFHRRRFVLAPLAELAPDLRDPRSGRRVADLLRNLDDPLRSERISPSPVRTARGAQGGALAGRSHGPPGGHP